MRKLIVLSLACLLAITFATSCKPKVKETPPPPPQAKEQPRVERVAPPSPVQKPQLSDEEIFLAKKIFHEELGAGRIVFADPADETGDALLLRADRSPNRQGAVRLGFPATGDLAAALRGASFAWIFGADRRALEPVRRLSAELAAVGGGGDRHLQTFDVKGDRVLVGQGNECLSGGAQPARW